MEAEDVALLPEEICFIEDFGYKKSWVTVCLWYDVCFGSEQLFFFCRSIFPARFWLGPDVLLLPTSMACTKVATIFSEPMRSGWGPRLFFWSTPHLRQRSQKVANESVDVKIGSFLRSCDFWPHILGESPSWKKSHKHLIIFDPIRWYTLYFLDIFFGIPRFGANGYSNFFFKSMPPRISPWLQSQARTGRWRGRKLGGWAPQEDL